jgi:YggT family protein
MSRLALVQLIDGVFYFYTLLLVVRVLSSWFPDIQDHPVLVFIQKLTDPYLNIFRRIIPPLGGMIDFSPIVAFFFLQILEQILKSILLR